MKIAVVCANGKAGKLITNEAVERGIDVTAVVRGDNKTNAEKVITKAMNIGTAIGFERGPSVQAGLLTSQSIIEDMFQRIIVNGEDVYKAAKESENQFNNLFSSIN